MHLPSLHLISILSADSQGEMSFNGRHLMLASDDMCYLCLDGGFLEPLRRDCACRGTDAGFVHLSCLTKYAATKSMLTLKMSRG
jgi:hypothetical protein